MKVPRRDLVGHMTESAQHHLLTATLLNLRLTRELHQKMEKKDQQIVDLQKQVKEQGNNIDAKFRNLEQQAGNLDTKVSDLMTTMQTDTVKIHNDLLLLNGFSSHEFTLIEFTKQQTKPSHGHWDGGVFTAQGWSFTFDVFTKGAGSAFDTHLTAYIDKDHVTGKTEGVAILQMLNQLGDHGHHIGTETRLLKDERIFLGDSVKFFPLNRLGYCADTNTQYLKDDCLKFRLFMKVKAR